MEEIDLTEAELQSLLAHEVAELPAELRAVYARLALTPVRCFHAIEFDGRRLHLPIWVVARTGQTVVGYDEAEEDFGIGQAGEGGEVRAWGTFGARLSWTLARLREMEREASDTLLFRSTRKTM